MAYTRTQLEAEIDALLVTNNAEAITAALLNALLKKINDNVANLDDSASDLSAKSINLADPTTGYCVSGVKVVGAQGVAIDYVDEGTPAIADIAAKLNLVIVALQTHGLIAPYIAP